MPRRRDVAITTTKYPTNNSLSSSQSNIKEIPRYSTDPQRNTFGEEYIKGLRITQTQANNTNTPNQLNRTSEGQHHRTYSPRRGEEDVENGEGKENTHLPSQKQNQVIDLRSQEHCTLPSQTDEAQCAKRIANTADPRDIFSSSLPPTTHAESTSEALSKDQATKTTPRERISLPPRPVPLHTGALQIPSKPKPFAPLSNTSHLSYANVTQPHSRSSSPLPWAPGKSYSDRLKFTGHAPMQQVKSAISVRRSVDETASPKFALNSHLINMAARRQSCSGITQPIPQKPLVIDPSQTTRSSASVSQRRNGHVYPDSSPLHSMNLPPRVTSGPNSQPLTRITSGFHTSPSPLPFSSKLSPNGSLGHVKPKSISDSRTYPRSPDAIAKELRDLILPCDTRAPSQSKQDSFDPSGFSTPEPYTLSKIETVDLRNCILHNSNNSNDENADRVLQPRNGSQEDESESDTSIAAKLSEQVNEITTEENSDADNSDMRHWMDSISKFNDEYCNERRGSTSAQSAVDPTNPWEYSSLPPLSPKFYQKTLSSSPVPAFTATKFTLPPPGLERRRRGFLDMSSRASTAEEQVCESEMTEGRKDPFSHLSRSLRNSSLEPEYNAISRSDVTQSRRYSFAFENSPYIRHTPSQFISTEVDRSNKGWHTATQPSPDPHDSDYQSIAYTTTNHPSTITRNISSNAKLPSTESIPYAHSMPTPSRTPYLDHCKG